VPAVQKPNLLVRDLQQLQNNRVSSHVPQKSLLLLTALPDRGAFLNTQLAQPQEDLQKTLALELKFRILFQNTPGGSQRVKEMHLHGPEQL